MPKKPREKARQPRKKKESMYDESPPLTPEDIEKLDELRADARVLMARSLFARYKQIYEELKKRKRKVPVETLHVLTICQLISDNNHHLLTYLEDLGVIHS